MSISSSLATYSTPERSLVTEILKTDVVTPTLAELGKTAVKAECLTVETLFSGAKGIPGRENNYLFMPAEDHEMVRNGKFRVHPEGELARA